MSKRRGLTRFAALLLGLTLLWRMLGAPVTGEDWANLRVPLWQARVLLPGRMARVLRLWAIRAPDEPAAEPSLLTADADPDASALRALAGNTLTLTVWDGKRLRSMGLEDYVCGVVAAEMPASYHIEALKAQAVAARTRAIYQCRLYGGAGCSSHPEADVCTDSAHCQGYATVADGQALWGAEYSLYRERVAQAVRETAGLLLTYEGKPIEVFYHAISGGHTEDAQAVFAQARPYLIGVQSDGEEGARGFREDKTFTQAECVRLLNDAFPDARLTEEDFFSQFEVTSHTESGRARSVRVGDSVQTASDVRAALGLRSTWFTISLDATTVTFHQQGYGHGVGMSQAGANAMASDGATYEAILAHYYQGAALTATLAQ